MLPLRDLLQLDLDHVPSCESVPKILRAVRLHLGMDKAFVSRIDEDQATFLYVEGADASGADSGPRPGDTRQLGATYCGAIVEGRLPQLIPDARATPAARDLEATNVYCIGAFIGVPITLPDGHVFGMLCCYSTRARPSLNLRDQSLLEVLADLIGIQLFREVRAERKLRSARSQIHAALSGDLLSIAYQPIVHLGTGLVTGFECLSRFASQPYRGPDQWFSEARSVGLGDELECRAIELALPALSAIATPAYLALNLSPGMSVGLLEQVLAGHPLERIVLEITEHEAIEEYAVLRAKLSGLRKQGVRISIDDAGAGYASFKHILGLSPDFIKLDRSLTRDIDQDPAKRALAAAMVHFCAETGSAIVAEGVETALELRALTDLGVSKAQGYFLGRPKPLEAALADCPGRWPSEYEGVTA